MSLVTVIIENLMCNNIQMNIKTPQSNNKITAAPLEKAMDLKENRIQTSAE